MTFLRCALLIGLFWLPAVASFGSEGPSASEVGSLHDLEARRLGGLVESLDRYRGSVVLIVNTASYCGFTSQLSGLQELHDRYRERGFSVLGFPSNSFHQEKETDDEIANFCRRNYGVEFPMFSKVEVEGEDAHPVYRFLTSRPAPLGGAIRWNFEKILVDREGKPVARFPSRVAPDDRKLLSNIEELLDL